MQITPQSNNPMATSPGAAAPQAMQSVKVPQLVQPTSITSRRHNPAGPAQMDAARPQGPPPPPSPEKMASNLARLDSFAEHAMAPLTNAAQDAPESEMPAFREAAASLESGLARLRAGMADGTLHPQDIQRGVTNSFQGAQEILESARDQMTDMGGDPMQAAPETAAMAPAPAGDNTEMGEMVRARYSGFSEHVMGRIEGLEGLDAETEKAALQLGNDFQSAMARLDQALFNPVSGDPIDRGTHRQIYERALGTLQTQLADLIGDSSQGRNPGGVVYGADSMAQGMKPSSFGLDVAG